MPVVRPPITRHSGRFTRLSAQLSTSPVAARGTPPPLTSQVSEFVQTELGEGGYGFNLGMPGPDLIPLQQVRGALNDAIDASGRDPLVLQYRTPLDFLEFRQNLAALLSVEHGVSITAEKLAITGGNSVALGMLLANNRLRRPLPPGAAPRPAMAVVETPTYFLAGGIMAEVGIEARGCSVDADGLCVDEVEAMCHAGDVPDFVYTIPNFQNPRGTVLSATRRRTLLALAEQFDFLVISDEPYSLLHYSGVPGSSGDRQAVGGGTSSPLPLAAEDTTPSGRVISLGSFSKILAPGMRLGWLHGNEALLQRAYGSSGVLDSGGALNPLGSLAVNQLIKNGALLANLQLLRHTFGARLAAMCAAVDKFCPAATYIRPNGGYFLWLELPAALGDDSAAQLLARSVAQPPPDACGRTVSYTLGKACVAASDGAPAQLGLLGRCLRLSFAFHSSAEIEDGVRILGWHLQAMEQQS